MKTTLKKRNFKSNKRVFKNLQAKFSKNWKPENNFIKIVNNLFGKIVLKN